MLLKLTKGITEEWWTKNFLEGKIVKKSQIYFFFSLVFVQILSEIISFESLLTTFEVSVIFEAAWALSKIGSSLKLNHRSQI